MEQQEPTKFISLLGKTLVEIQEELLSKSNLSIVDKGDGSDFDVVWTVIEQQLMPSFIGEARKTNDLEDLLARFKEGFIQSFLDTEKEIFRKLNKNES